MNFQFKLPKVDVSETDREKMADSAQTLASSYRKDRRWFGLLLYVICKFIATGEKAPKGLMGILNSIAAGNPILQGKLDNNPDLMLVMCVIVLQVMYDGRYVIEAEVNHVHALISALAEPDDPAVQQRRKALLRQLKAWGKQLSSVRGSSNTNLWINAPLNWLAGAPVGRPMSLREMRGAWLRNSPASFHGGTVETESIEYMPLLICAPSVSAKRRLRMMSYLEEQAGFDLDRPIPYKDIVAITAHNLLILTADFVLLPSAIEITRFDLDFELSPPPMIASYAELFVSEAGCKLEIYRSGIGFRAKADISLQNPNVTALITKWVWDCVLQINASIDLLYLYHSAEVEQPLLQRLTITLERDCPLPDSFFAVGSSEPCDQTC